MPASKVLLAYMLLCKLYLYQAFELFIYLQAYIIIPSIAFLYGRQNCMNCILKRIIIPSMLVPFFVGYNKTFYFQIIPDHFISNGNINYSFIVFFYLFGYFPFVIPQYRIAIRRERRINFYLNSIDVSRSHSDLTSI